MHRTRSGRPRKNNAHPNIQGTTSASRRGDTEAYQGATTTVAQNGGGDSASAHVSGPRLGGLAGVTMNEEQERALAFDIGRAQALDNDRAQAVDSDGAPEVSANNLAPEVFDNAPNLSWPINDETGIVQTALFTSMFSSLSSSQSRVSSDILLGLLKLLARTALVNNLPHNAAQQVLDNIPQCSRTVRSRYGLSEEPETFAVCPRCHYLNPPTSRDEARLPIYPRLCTNASSLPGTVCGGKLLDSNGELPRKTFVYNTVRKFIGRLLSEEETEKLIDKSCTELLNTSMQTIPELRGPFDAQFLRGLGGHQPGVPFISGTNDNEARLAFSLNVGFSCVGGVRAGAAPVSCGVIALACLNLPAEIRYKDENMLLAGIIPGPDEPSVTELNRYLKPLVDEFLKLWDPGVYYSRTASSPHGRMARAVIANVVCDLPCARKVCGFMSPSSKSFVCSRCHVTRERIGEVDTPSGLRDTNFLRGQARLWKDARNINVRKDITETAGVRWSDLWRLPYWDPVQQLVIDPTHCLLLGLVQNHFTAILPLSLKVAESSANGAPFKRDFKQVPSPPDRVRIANVEYFLTELDVQQVSDIHCMLQQPINAVDTEAEKTKLIQRLATKHKLALMFVLDSLGLDVPTTVTKQAYADSLSTWRFHQPLHSPTNVATTGLIQYIQRVISTTTVPTFVRPVSHNFGTSHCGHLPSQGQEFCN